jgi:hypothetical protein
LSLFAAADARGIAPADAVNIIPVAELNARIALKD